MHYHVLGAGSIGCLFGSQLLKSGNKVTLLFRRSNLHHDFLSQGSKLSIIKSSQKTNYAGFDSQLLTKSSPEKFENVLVTTKAHHTLSAINSIRDNVTSDSLLILLQNGMGVIEELTELFEDWKFSPKLIIGTTNHGCFRESSDLFLIHHASQGEASFCLLDYNFDPLFKNNDLDRVSQVWKELSKLPLNIETQVESKLMREKLLFKLAVNCCINPIASLFHIKNGELLNNQVAILLIKEICDEIAQVFSNMKPTISDPILLDKEKLFESICNVITKVKDNRCSMLQDLEDKRQTEIDYINQFIVNQGEKYGVQTNANQLIVKLIKNKEMEYLN
ncbi:2-dehydropantoate 2-reductase [Neoconidiobolus thromboides FSU 785]|nr:2-dehydropantoate 2-reductase [Neoconidiobolus thromboides FSU 785]